jgi:ubiquinone/menaquinone biosynthesis C-methylase UbiE
MTDARPVKPSDGASQREHYSHGYDPKMVAYLETRSARKDAAFLVPHLRAGMSLLDCGCGPGALTADLAQLVAPGQVVGIDIAPSRSPWQRSTR